ncbi:MAG TPA: tetratricopeptide repeat protein [Pyrinomonadaceae bacterium]|jgi:Flp pilus assembly protein TadD|nr:tetratricopeptide repeat protein [Pyrinomonadaceae bacterium]
MRTRTIIAITLAVTLCFGATALWTADTTGRDGDTDANIIDANGSPTGRSTEAKKGGNKIARIFKAPFKAVAKLFGGSRDENRLRRLNEKDVAKFESAGALRVSDNVTVAERMPSARGTAREHLMNGRALLGTGRVNEAIAELTLAASLDPQLSGEANGLLGLAYDQKGMRERAKESYERAMRESPEDAQNLNNLGFSLYQNGNYRAAVDRLKRAARLAPTDQRILNNLALAQCRLGKYEDAYRNFARAGGELTGRLNTAAMLERLGRDEEAIRYYEAARRLQPNSSITLRRLVDLYRRMGRTNESEDAQRALTALAERMTVARN